MKKQPDENRKNRRKRLPRILYFFVLLSFIVPVVFITLRMIFNNNAENEAGYHSNADYALMLLECLLGVLVIHLPSIITKRFRVEIPVILYILYLVFLYCAIFLGEVGSFYYLIPNWDVMLHALSSVMTGLFGFMMVTILNRNEKLVISLSPFFVALFAFTFSVTIGALWEIYEFTFDGLLGLNMQKFMTADGTLLVGHDALGDTMKDIIVDVCGALIASLIGLLSIRKNKFWYTGILTDKPDGKN